MLNRAIRLSTDDLLKRIDLTLAAVHLLSERRYFAIGGWMEDGKVATGFLPVEDSEIEEAGVTAMAYLEGIAERGRLKLNGVQLN